MSELPPADSATPLRVGLSAPPKADNVLCERCSEDTYRVHGVWRCPACGFKTDCCGW